MPKSVPGQSRQNLTAWQSAGMPPRPGGRTAEEAPQHGRTRNGPRPEKGHGRCRHRPAGRHDPPGGDACREGRHDVGQGLFRGLSRGWRALGRAALSRGRRHRTAECAGALVHRRATRRGTRGIDLLSLLDGARRKLRCRSRTAHRGGDGRRNPRAGLQPVGRGLLQPAAPPRLGPRAGNLWRGYAPPRRDGQRARPRHPGA